MIWLWVGFVVFVLLILALDLGVLHRGQKAISTGTALRWTVVFMTLGASFAGVVYYLYSRDVAGIGTRFVERLEGRHADAGAAGRTTPGGPASGDGAAGAGGSGVAASGVAAEGAGSGAPGEARGRTPPTRPGGARVSALEEARASPGKVAMTQYLAGWLTEYTLSIDNIFVIAIIFAHFRVPAGFQHRVLFWGIMGALIMRGVMIATGAALVQRFEWVLVVFGVFLVLTGLKIFFVREQGEGDFDEEHSRVVRLAKRVFPIAPGFDGQNFFTRVNGKRMATTLFLVLIIVEFTDVIFAVDSIPAILGITTDPFLVFTSNVFAIMGLRSLYFALAGLRDKFDHLKFSLGFILLFVGGKMIYEYFLGHVSSTLSLGIIAASLAVGIGSSLFAASRRPEAKADAPEPATTTERPEHPGV